MKAAFLIRDAKNVRDWSGLPYYVFQAFHSKYQADAILVETKNYFNIPELLFNLTIVKLYKYYYKARGVNILYSFTGSWLNRTITFLAIWANRRKINQADYLITTVVPYGLEKFIRIPVIAFSDGSYEFLAQWKFKRALMGPEINVNKKSYRAINHFAITICLFYQVYDDLVIKGIPPSKLIYFPGGLNLPGLNTLTQAEITAKFHNKTILFIGRKHYQDGAVKLVRAFSYIKSAVPRAKLTIVGIPQSELNLDPNLTDIQVIPYLDKNNSDDLIKYEKLLTQATLFVNVAEKGGAYMTTMEAMAYGTPFILKTYPEIVSFMKTKPTCGTILSTDVDDQQLAQIVINLMADKDKWTEQSQNAMQTARKMKWENLFIDIEDRLQQNSLNNHPF
jgi:glycosyltransferase involved in cell wall biosynthesis